MLDFDIIWFSYFLNIYLLLLLLHLYQPINKYLPKNKWIYLIGTIVLYVTVILLLSSCGIILTDKQMAIFAIIFGITMAILQNKSTQT